MRWKNYNGPEDIFYFCASFGFIYLSKYLNSVHHVISTTGGCEEPSETSQMRDSSHEIVLLKRPVVNHTQSVILRLHLGDGREKFTDWCSPRTQLATDMKTEPL